jgi:cytosine/uracil/thiamine/allantoin permease
MWYGHDRAAKMVPGRREGRWTRLQPGRKSTRHLPVERIVVDDGGINQAIGQKAAGMTNSSDFSRYAKKKSDYIIGTVVVYWFVGVLVCFGGLVTTAACQKIYGQIYWNPPDLLMVMMDSKS